jgi:hypothetical protein
VAPVTGAVAAATEPTVAAGHETAATVFGTVDAATTTVDTGPQAVAAAAGGAEPVATLAGDTTAIAVPVLGAPVAELPVHTIPGVQPVDAIGALSEPDTTWTTQATGLTPVYDLGDMLHVDPADQRLLIAAGIIAVTGVAFGQTGVESFREACASNARVMFTNVRLLPCYAEETVRRYAAAATETIRTQGGATSTKARERSSRMSAAAAEMLDAVRGGFERVTREREADGEGDAERDRRLLAQIGVVLGLVYLAFLTVWFWATRLRWQPRI